MEKILARCSKCGHGKWQGDDCTYCLNDRGNKLIARMAEQKIHKPEFIQIAKKIDKVRPEIKAINMLRDELKLKLGMTHFMAEYTVITWHLGHTIQVKTFTDEQLMHITSAFGYLDEHYGSYKKRR